MEYVLFLHYGKKGHCWIDDQLGFYTGKKYVCQGEIFACSCHNPEDAKKYSSRTRALLAFDALTKNVSNAMDYTLYFRAASNNKFEPTRE